MNITDPAIATAAQHDGMEAATEHTDAEWATECQRGIALAAALGLPFQAADLEAAGIVPEPRHPNHWGPQFAIAHRQGVVEPIGVAKSKRASVRNSLCRVWIGTSRKDAA